MRLHINHIALILLIPWSVQAQEQVQETKYAIKLDSTIHNKWAPTGVRVGLDIAGPIYNLFEPTISNYEGTADIDFGKFFAVVEMGNGNYQSTETPTSYTSAGLFFRLGADINLTAKDPKLNTLFFGLRYATAAFNETLKGEIANLGWGANPVDVEQSKSKANWIEMNIGMRVRISKSFFSGYSLRFKLLKHNVTNNGEFETYFVPGYGVANNTTNWGVSYYIQYRFEWKKKPIPWKEN